MVDQYPNTHTAAPVHRKKNGWLSLKDISRLHRSLLKLWCPDKNLSFQDHQQPESRIKPKDQTKANAKAKTKTKSIAKAKTKAKVEDLPEEPDFQLLEELSDKDSDDEIEEEETMYGVNSYRYNGDGTRGDPASTAGFTKTRSGKDNYFPNVPSPLSKSSSKRSTTPTRSSLNRMKSGKSMDSSGTPTSLSKNASQRSTTPTASSIHRMSGKSIESCGPPSSLSKNASRRSTTPIMYSNSRNRVIKPPPVEKKLECTLEELGYGCTKKIKITRDVFTTTGEETKEEEILTIKVKAGWKKGTKVTFEGMGNEVPGGLPADVTFIISEKKHQLFSREGDDLELGIEIPLVKALTGCNLSIPILGGDNVSLTINDIIHPGDVKIVEGQGMPNQKNESKRGNLKVVFLVEFPTELTNEQRADILSILAEGSS